MKNRIGIVGGGQLARMLSFDAKKMGFKVVVLDPTPDSPAGQVSDKQIIGGYKDEKATRELASQVDVITIDAEFVNDEVLANLEKSDKPVYPSAKTITIIKDKLLQKGFLKKAGIPVAEFIQITHPVISTTDKEEKSSQDYHTVKRSLSRSSIEMTTKEKIEKAAKIFGYPLLLKARMDAYDGKGNYLIKNKKDIENGLKKLAGRALYLEKFVPFVKELAVMVARNTKGEIVSYPVVETIHKNNILHIVKVPAPIDKKNQLKAQRLAKKVMQHLKGAGVFGIEMFLTPSPGSGQAKLFVNEIAPRVHNSGHYTIEACFTSQFEQHIRAIMGMPLGRTDLVVPSAVMINILGKRYGTAEVKGLDKVLQLPNTTVHIYGKAETKIERKMGHITVVGNDSKKTLRLAKKARKLITI